MNKNNNNGNRRTSLRLQSKLAKSRSQTVHSSASLSTSCQEESSVRSNENNVMNNKNQENLKFAMILRSNLLMSNNSKNSNAAAISSTNVISVSSSTNVSRKSSQEINRKKMFKLGKNSDKKQKLKPKKSLTISTNITKNNNNNNNKKRRKNVKKDKKVKTWPITARSSQNIRVLEDNDEDDENDNEQIDSTHSSARPTTSAALSFRAAEASEFASITQPSLNSINTTNTSATTTDQTTSTIIAAAASMNAASNNMFTLPSSDHSNMNTSSMPELKFQLKKATVKFNKACRQLTLLDQHMSDLQNSYSNAVENDRKTFKIVFRMQLATLEGTHNAYIEYIERQVEKIKKLKHLLFTDTNINQHLTH